MVGWVDVWQGQVFTVPMEEKKKKKEFCHVCMKLSFNAGMKKNEACYMYILYGLCVLSKTTCIFSETFFAAICCESLSVCAGFITGLSTQQAHDVIMTSDRRRCDVMTSHRRRYDVIMTSCARWVQYAI